jgi:uncharacterized oligopeptide transporter (OPT) family protein
MARPFLDVFPGTRHLVVRWQLLGIASVLAAIGLGFLAFALDQRLSEQIGPSAAAATTGGLLVVIAILFVAVSAIVATRTPKAPPPGQGIDIAAISEMVGMLINLNRKLSVELRPSVKPLMIASLVIGCAVGLSPDIQQKLKKLIG